MDDATTQSRNVWDALAPGWASTREALNAREQPATDRMHHALDVRPEDTILELCAGPGEVGLQVAQAHRQARVIVSDFAPSMVEVARTEAERRGLSNVDTRVIDAQHINLPNASVDGVVCRFGLMLVPDIPRAFHEVRRVLREGRSLVYTTWAPLDANPWMAIFGAAMVQCGHFAPPQGGAFMPLATPEDNVAAARAAGFDAVDAEAVDLPQHFADFDEYWNVQRQVAGPLAVIVKALADDEVEAVRTVAVGLAEPFRVGNGLSFPSRRILVHAR